MPGSVERIRALALMVALLGAACAPRAGEPAVTMPASASALAIEPDYAGTIWAATGGRVYRSHDGGHTWRRVPGRGAARCGPVGGPPSARPASGGAGSELLCCHRRVRRRRRFGLGSRPTTA